MTDWNILTKIFHGLTGSMFCQKLVIFGMMTCCYVSLTSAYKHVVFMHGILADPKEFDDMVKLLKSDHPGTITTQIDDFNNLHSLEPMWNQVYKIQIQVTEIMRENPEGIHLVCYSQGGLICRALVSSLRHNVDTFIALSSPLVGQYGDTVYLKFLFPNYIKEDIYKYFYTDAGQKWSIANYWYDPHQTELYKKFSEFLAVLNNDTFNGQSHWFKENFSSIKKLVLIGGPDDGVITPWQSAHFGMYNGSEVTLPMQDQRWYKEDSFGLKTLDKRNAIIMDTYTGVHHTVWPFNREVYKKSILPHLT